MCSVGENKDEGQTFGTFLREQREHQGLTLRKFAELCGVAASYVSNIESGSMPPPSVPVIERMASVLHLRPNVLLVRAGKLSASTWRWFWSQPMAMDLLGCASGLNESLARMYVITSLTQLPRSPDSIEPHRPGASEICGLLARVGVGAWWEAYSS